MIQQCGILLRLPVAKKSLVIFKNKILSKEYDVMNHKIISFSVNMRGEFRMDINVDIIFKIAAIGIIVAVLNQVLTRAGREDQAMMTTLAGIIVVLLLIVHMINDFFIAVKTLFQL
jgi:stage III sporulation protein AC